MQRLAHLYQPEEKAVKFVLDGNLAQPALLNSGGDNLLVSGSNSGNKHSQAGGIKLCFLSLLHPLLGNPEQLSSVELFVEYISAPGKLIAGHLS